MKRCRIHPTLTGRHRSIICYQHLMTWKNLKSKFGASLSRNTISMLPPLPCYIAACGRAQLLVQRKKS